MKSWKISGHPQNRSFYISIQNPEQTGIWFHYLAGNILTMLDGKVETWKISQNPQNRSYRYKHPKPRTEKLRVSFWAHYRTVHHGQKTEHQCLPHLLWWNLTFNKNCILTCPQMASPSKVTICSSNSTFSITCKLFVLTQSNKWDRVSQIGMWQRRTRTKLRTYLSCIINNVLIIH